MVLIDYGYILPWGEEGERQSERELSAKEEKKMMISNSFLGELPAAGHFSYLVMCLYVCKSKTPNFHSNGAIMW